MTEAKNETPLPAIGTPIARPDLPPPAEGPWAEWRLGDEARERIAEVDAAIRAGRAAGSLILSD